jgi:hypothetical protein
MKIMFFSNCIPGPKIVYLYRDKKKDIPFIVRLTMLNNMYVFEFDARSEEVVH